MMKRLTCFVLALTMLLGCASFALADDQMTKLNGQEKRNIKINEAGLNEVEAGISPTTGLTLAELDAPEGFAGLAVTGRYMPMLVQIDNTDGGVDNPDKANVTPWGASYADIVYETPLYSSGMTRITFLFSDLIPTSVGPIRSARMGHAWLREEWDAGFLYYGQQEYAKSNVRKELSEYGADDKGLLFSGTVGGGKPWKQFYTARAGSLRPHHIDANVAAMYELIPTDFVPPNHAFRFTDDLPADGDTAEQVIVKWGSKDGKALLRYGSNLEYDADNNVYYRYMRYANDELIPYEDRDTQEQMGFANVIVQFTDVEFIRKDAPISYVVGKYYYTGKGDKSVTGNAEYFMGGKHVEGVWKRDSMESRTVFYGPDGNEISLQRGKTLIIVCPTYTQISYR